MMADSGSQYFMHLGSLHKMLILINAPRETASAQELQILADQRMYEDKAQSRAMHTQH